MQGRTISSFLICTLLPWLVSKRNELSYHKKCKPKISNTRAHRKSYTELNEVYFWTITINKWQHLLKPEQNKMIVINSLQWHVQKVLVKIYGYVIIPTHIHLMWQQLKINGKELPKNSF